MIDFQKGWNAGDVNQVVTVGGITRSSFWMQQKANLIGLKIIVPNIEEPSALGAALLAGIGSGIYKDFETISELLNTKEARSMNQINQRQIFLPIIIKEFTCRS